MKKFLNDPSQFVRESLRGLAHAHRDLVALNDQPLFVTRAGAKPASGKVALISGGGSGHEPLHAGFVGHGMLDAACPGHVFTSPTPDQMAGAATAVDRGQGVLFIVKNYAGDVMNFEMGAELFAGQSASVLVQDDVGVESAAGGPGPRGVAGTLVVEKIVGAAAEGGADLPSCAALAQRVGQATASMGVALSSCTVPAAGKPTFQLGDAEMELGVGIHGEPGRRRVPLAHAEDLAADLLAPILHRLEPRASEPLLLFVNGFGGTPLAELYLMYDAAVRRLEKAGLTVARSLVGSYVTSLEMAGCSLTLVRLDTEMIRAWDAPVHTPALRWGR
jgi:dihydroxyacetone kinase-like protein